MGDFNLLGARSQEPIAIAPYHEWLFPDGTQWTQFYRLETGYLLRFPDLADFLISACANEVDCHPEFNVSKETTEHLYLNQVLPLILSKIGKHIFHASAVELSVGVVVFMGESGRGKSTLAASFATNGHGFLTDDGLHLEKTQSGYSVQPSHASIRLWSDSQDALISEHAKLAPAVQFTPKVRIFSDDKMLFCNEAKPLASIYFLGDGSSTQVNIHPCKPSDALIALVKNSFLLDVDQQDSLESHFNRLANIVELPIFYQLDYPRNFENLTDVRQAIIEHTLKRAGET